VKLTKRVFQNLAIHNFGAAAEPEGAKLLNDSVTLTTQLNALSAFRFCESGIFNVIDIIFVLCLLNNLI
jgi:hypothetical protein